MAPFDAYPLNAAIRAGGRKRHAFNFATTPTRLNETIDAVTSPKYASTN
jgi:hypothetical protein